MDTRTLVKVLAGMPPRKVSTKEEIDARRAERRARIAATPKKPKRMSYREMYAASSGASAVNKPVQFVRAFLDENFGTMKRREALDALVRAGVNMSTARRQYQKYKTKLEKKGSSNESTC